MKILPDVKSIAFSLRIWSAGELKLNLPAGLLQALEARIAAVHRQFVREHATQLYRGFAQLKHMPNERTAMLLQQTLIRERGFVSFGVYFDVKIFICIQCAMLN